MLRTPWVGFSALLVGGCLWHLLEAYPEPSEPIDWARRPKERPFCIVAGRPPGKGGVIVCSPSCSTSHESRFVSSITGCNIGQSVSITLEESICGTSFAADKASQVVSKFPCLIPHTGDSIQQPPYLLVAGIREIMHWRMLSLSVRGKTTDLEDSGLRVSGWCAGLACMVPRRSPSRSVVNEGSFIRDPKGLPGPLMISQRSSSLGAWYCRAHRH